MSRVPRPTYHHGNLRAAALERAAQLAADGGTGALSLRQLARDLGVSPAALYRHFADKDALLDGLAQRALAALESAARDALARAGGDQADAAERLAALGRGYLAFARAHPDAFRIVFELRPKAGRDPVEAAPYLLLLEAVTALAPPGADAARVRRAALAAWAFVHGLATLGAQQAWVAGEVAAAAEGLLRDYARGLRVGFPS
ncbi:MAG: TetR/AcrR family transcriptional regulator [Pseudomonadota bacterium]|jgi:AcrR family transcriptional regulator|nr:helix-turn-helix transcriptional regulator [Rubrivivax sp.]MCA3260162.1 helix-turn-helix transcriptional regulator [Rubrivivax sp.]MCE2912885.1 TetR/AcrR family transcriptional regulator; helix-turn-helix transcriptional regulator [Rubrivivax sp.]MCZ8032942.1 TetR/AcrR family transcriptional regulator [Rubrivivax sp.]